MSAAPQIAADDDGEPCTPTMTEATTVRLPQGASLRSASGSAASRRSHSFRAGLRKKGGGDDDLPLMNTGGKAEADGQDLLGQSTDSFYFRVTAALCSPCAEFGWRMAFDTVVCLLALMLQARAGVASPRADIGRRPRLFVRET